MSGRRTAGARPVGRPRPEAASFDACGSEGAACESDGAACESEGVSCESDGAACETEGAACGSEGDACGVVGPALPGAAGLPSQGDVLGLLLDRAKKSKPWEEARIGELAELIEKQRVPEAFAAAKELLGTPIYGDVIEKALDEGERPVPLLGRAVAALAPRLVAGEPQRNRTQVTVDPRPSRRLGSQLRWSHQRGGVALGDVTHGTVAPKRGQPRDRNERADRHPRA